MKLELLAPAGDFDALVAAVQNGADAVYFGTQGFNARASASNFGGEKLKEAVDYCHLHNVRVYVTVNTMVKEHELDALVETINSIYISNADAFIIQDLGVAEIAKKIAPKMEIHASTQMAVHSYQGVKYLAAHGFDRVVLAREMPFEEIEKCAGLGVNLESFAHGALCSACSGQCLMSSVIGGRSGNRGMCAQPCRMLYTMGEKTGYLLSTKDLETISFVDRIREAGVSSLKIEGRLKRPEYVAITTRIYRKAIDGEAVTESDLNDLKQIFNRGGFTKGYYYGVDDTELMFSDRPNNNGVKIGTVTKNGVIAPVCDINKDDNIVLRGNGDDIPVKLEALSGEKVNVFEARKGMDVIRLTSETLLNKARVTYKDENRPVWVDMFLRLRVGEKAMLRVTGAGYPCEVYGENVQEAKNKPLDEERVKEQLKKTGNTCFAINELALDCDINAFMPVSEINRLRRDALDGLKEFITRRDRRISKFDMPEISYPEREKPLLRVQSGDVELLKRALSHGADEIVFAPDDLRRLDDALTLEKFYLALPPVAHSCEHEKIYEWACRNRDKIKGLYITNVAHLDDKYDFYTIGDYTLNIANNIALNRLNTDEVSPSMELTMNEIRRLGSKKDLIVYGYLPLMFLRHCPNRAAMDISGKHADCRLCDSHSRLKKLTDRTGAEFELKRLASDSGCVIKVMNSVPLNLLNRLDKMGGAHAYRMLINDEHELDMIDRFRSAIDGEPFDLDKSNKYTTGHYFRGVE